MLLSQRNETNLLNSFSITNNNNNNNTVNLESNINAELQRLKEEEKYLQAILEFKFHKELINHLERDKELETIKSTTSLNNSFNSGQQQELNDHNMTTTHLLFHKITNECPMCEKNSISSLILSSSNERNQTKINPNETKQSSESKNTRPNVVFSKAYKNSRPQYVTNLKTLIQTPIIRDIDSNLRLSFNENMLTNKRTKSESNLNTINMSKSVQFENGTLNSFAKNLASDSTNELAYAKAFRDKHFYGNKPPKTAVINELQNEKQEQKYIQLPLTKTLVHDRAWNYGKNYKQSDVSYYPFRDSKIKRNKV